MSALLFSVKWTLNASGTNVIITDGGRFGSAPGTYGVSVTVPAARREPAGRRIRHDQRRRNDRQRASDRRHCQKSFPAGRVRRARFRADMFRRFVRRGISGGEGAARVAFRYGRFENRRSAFVAVTFQVLARKTSLLYKLCRDGLSSPINHAFDLRSFKLIVKTARDLMTERPELEENAIIMTVLRSVHNDVFFFVLFPRLFAIGRLGPRPAPTICRHFYTGR